MASDTCLFCGRELVDAESVQRGIGPRCLEAVEKIRAIHPEPDIDPGQITLKPSRVIVEKRVRRSLGDLSELCTSIAEVGLLHPIVVTHEGVLVAGQRRLEAWKLLYGDTPVPVTCVPDSLDDLLRAEVDENKVRKPFLPSELGAAYLRLKPHLAEEAKQRQEATLPSEGQKGFQCGGKFPPHKGKTRDILGQAMGVSGKTLEKAAVVYEAAQTDPEAAELLRQADIGKESIHSAYTQLKEKQEKQDTEKPEKENKPHVTHYSGEYEWYTPIDYIEAARLTMGSIDVDPASCSLANKNVKAETFYTKEDDGLLQDWPGNVWLNPPYSQPEVSDFCALLVEKYQSGEVKQACVLVNNATETKHYQNMLKHCSAVCFIKGRIRFIDQHGEPAQGSPLQGQTILYFGDQPRLFGENFCYFGGILYAA